MQSKMNAADTLSHTKSPKRFCGLMRTLPPPFLFVLLAQLLQMHGLSQSEAGLNEGTAVRLTIQQAIEEAVHNNLNLLADQLNLTIAEARLITAKLKPNPVFSFGSDHLDVLGTGFNVDNAAGPPEISWRVDVPIERGGKRQLRIDTANYEREIAGTHLVDSVRKLKLDVTLACIDVIEAKAGLALARDNFRTFEDLVQTNVVRVKAGSIAPLELTRSQVAMLQFRRNVKQAELTLLTTKTKLQNLLGRKMLMDDFDLLDELKAPPTPRCSGIDILAGYRAGKQARPSCSPAYTGALAGRAEAAIGSRQGGLYLGGGVSQTARD